MVGINYRIGIDGVGEVLIFFCVLILLCPFAIIRCFRYFKVDSVSTEQSDPLRRVTLYYTLF
jgi:hypothetical protein